MLEIKPILVHYSKSSPSTPQTKSLHPSPIRLA